MLVWRLDDRRGALPVNVVDRVLPAMALQALPDAPAKLLGIARLQGRAMPVVDLRRHLGEPARDLRPSDRLVLVKNGPWRFGLCVDAVEDTLVAGGPGAPPSLDLDRLFGEDDVRRLTALGVPA